MIKLNTKDDHVEVAISGNATTIARELHALLDCIKNNESMQEALIVALAVDAISEEEHKENTDGMSEILKSVFRKGNKHENLKS